MVRLSVKNRQLVIEGEAEGTVPIEDIRTLMIESRTASITTYALSALSEKGVCVYVCDEKHLPCAVLHRNMQSKSRAWRSECSQEIPQILRGKRQPYISRICLVLVFQGVRRMARV